MTTVPQNETPQLTNEGAGPIPEANQPGHHPETEQDKPYAKFAESVGNEQTGTGHDSERPKLGLVVGGLALALAGLAIRAIVRRFRTSRTDQLTHSLAKTVSDTARSVTDTVESVKDRLPS